MATQKISKSLPKRAMNDKLKSRRAGSYATGQARKEQRRKAQEKAHAANVALFDQYKQDWPAGRILPACRRVRLPRDERHRLCLRCRARTIVPGQVCWCRQIGAAA